MDDFIIKDASSNIIGRHEGGVFKDVSSNNYR